MRHVQKMLKQHRSPTPLWLTQTPIAHRGLHNFSKGVIENSRLSFLLAMMGNFAIECDVQLSKDEQAIVFHDKTLERITQNTGYVCDFDALALCATPLKSSDDTIMSLPMLLELVAGRVPLFIEIKSAVSGDDRLSQAVFDALKTYSAPVCVMSFDPHIVTWFSDRHPPYPVGLVAPQDNSANISLYRDILPDFLAWNAQNIPHEMPTQLREEQHRPVITWTIRSEIEAQKALIHADQIIFEGYIPEI